MHLHNASTLAPPGHLAGSLDQGDTRIRPIGTQKGMMTNPAATIVSRVIVRVIVGWCATIAAEIGHVLSRMSFSSITWESQTLQPALFDATFNPSCQSLSTPIHIGPILGHQRGIAQKPLTMVSGMKAACWPPPATVRPIRLIWPSL